MRGDHEILAFNRGVVSRLALSRIDLNKMKFSAEIQRNWMPRALGSMMLRPGLGYLGAFPGQEKLIEFIFSAQDTALIEMSAGQLRVWKDDALVTRPANGSAFTNGTFNTDLSGWTDLDQAGATSIWVAGGFMGLTGDGTNYAIREQQVVAAAGDQAVRIVVTRGSVTIRAGSVSGGTQFLRDTTLGAGTHSIVIPTTGASFFFQFRSRTSRQVLIDSIAIEAAGAMTLPTPYAAADLQYLRAIQSGDVIFLACRGYQQRKIERRSNGSWSVTLYQPVDGPFRVQNTTPTTLTATGLSGNISITASSDVFAPGHVGALFSLTSVGQIVTTSLSAANTFGDPIRITGVGDARAFSIVNSGTFVANLTLQRSVGSPGTWQDVPGETYTGVGSKSYNDGLDNQIIYYRVGIKTGDYTSGTATTTLSYASGSITGVVRITAYISPTSVSAEVLSPLGGLTATDTWAEGLWSDFRGWPSAVAIHDGRLWWCGKDKFNGSVTDAFESFDPDFEGDAGPISRSIGFGPVDSINWLISLDRLVAGTDSMELACRSSALDEPLTPTNFTPKKTGTQGTAAIPAQEIDGSGIFVQRCLSRLYQMSYGNSAREYDESDLTALVPDLCSAGVVGIKIQRQPDTRLHVWLADGTVAVLIIDRTENLLCWVTIQTDGVVEDVAVLPGVEEDAVYYAVRREVQGVVVRYLEKWALESEARGGVTNKIADSFVMGSGSSVSAPHLINRQVTIWADGNDVGTAIVDGSGNVALPGTYASVCVGLFYEAIFKSTKMAYVVPPGKSGLHTSKRLNALGLVLVDTHAQGVQFGQRLDELNDMPQVEDGFEIDVNQVWSEYDKDVVPMDGSWDNDARLFLRAASPRPATVTSAVITMANHS